MLRSVPKSWFSSTNIVLENDTYIGLIKFSAWRRGDELTIKESTYRAYREGFASGSFVLETGGSILLRAEKPSALYRTFLLEHGGKKYTLEAEAALSRTFVLLERGNQVGSVYREGFLGRKAVADFSDEIPLAVRIFMFWLVMISWNSSDSAN